MKYKETNIEIHAGDYIRYTFKNELGKLIRVADDNRVFAWFHTGDTASGITTDFFTLVLQDSVAKAMSEEDIIAYFNEDTFSNNYAIKEIVEKKIERIKQRK